MCDAVNYKNLVLYRRHQLSDFQFDETIKESDWSNAIYFFLEEKDLAKYDDTAHLYPKKITLKTDLKCIVCSMDCFKDGSYGEETMEQLIDDIMYITGIKTRPDKKGFLYWLGQNGYAFQCFHDNDSQEIAIPYNVLNQTQYEVEDLASPASK